jgi:hypothetical protein
MDYPFPGQGRQTSDAVRHKKARPESPGRALIGGWGQMKSSSDPTFSSSSERGAKLQSRTDIGIAV